MTAGSTLRELFERLQEAHPGPLPRRAAPDATAPGEKRHALAHKMVFGAAAAGEISGIASTLMTQ
jgi:hypothetical protein